MSKYSMEQLGKRIATARRAQHMTQDELAVRLAITPQAISKWETGTGLPDVTLFPAIADALGMSIGELFGEAPRTPPSVTPEFPLQHEGMKLVGQAGRVGCYSNKQIQETNGHLLYFTDGSEADLREQTVTNRGTGEVRFLEFEPQVYAPLDTKETALDESFASFQSLDIRISYRCDVKILFSEQGEYRLHAEGSARFISLIETQLGGDKLSIRVKSMNNTDASREKNNLTIYMGALHGHQLYAAINGSSDIDIQPTFDTGEVTINGSGIVQTTCFDELDVGINGSGDVTVKDVLQKARIHINGSGNVSADHLGNPLQVSVAGSGDVCANSAENVSIRIAGSGDVTLKQIGGQQLNASVAGSGDIQCGGKVEQLTLTLDGSGDFNGDKLTVGEAILRSKGNASITIGHILRHSQEKLSKNTTLRVGKRG